MRNIDNNHNSSNIDTLQKKNRAPWFILFFVVLILIVWSIFAIHSENQHRKISKLYAEAFVLYQNFDLSQPYDLHQDEKIQKTIEALSLVAEFSGNFVEKYIALTQMGLLYIYQNKDGEAVPLLEKVRTAPKKLISKVQAMTLLARLYEKEKKLDLAIKVYEELEGQTDGEALNFVRYQLGILYSTDTQNIKKSIAMYEKIQQDSSFKASAEKNIFMLNTIVNSSETKN